VEGQLGKTIAVTRTAAKSQRCLIKMCRVSVVGVVSVVIIAAAAAPVPTTVPANPSFPLPCVFCQQQKQQKNTVQKNKREIKTTD